MNTHRRIHRSNSTRDWNDTYASHTTTVITMILGFACVVFVTLLALPIFTNQLHP